MIGEAEQRHETRLARYLAPKQPRSPSTSDPAFPELRATRQRKGHSGASRIDGSQIRAAHLQLCFVLSLYWECRRTMSQSEDVGLQNEGATNAVRTDKRAK